MVRSLLQQETTSTARSFSLDINELPLGCRICRAAVRIPGVAMIVDCNEQRHASKQQLSACLYSCIDIRPFECVGRTQACGLVACFLLLGSLRTDQPGCKMRNTYRSLLGLSARIPKSIQMQITSPHEHI